MKYFLVLFLILLTFAHASAQTGVTANQIPRVAGTRVTLTPPPGFTPSQQFPGYAKESASASIIVTEMPAPYIEALAGFSDDAGMAKRGMKVLSRQDVTIDGRRGVLLYIKQTALQTEFLKWALFVGDATESLMVVAMFPKELQEDYSLPLKESLLTARWDQTGTVPFDEGLNFSVAEKGSLKFAKRMTNALMYSEHGAFPQKSVDAPLFIVASSLRKLDIPDIKAFSESRILSTASIKGIEIKESTAITIDGLRGHEIVANAKDDRTGEPMIVYQATLLDGEIYYVMQGLISSKNKTEHLETFRAMAKSFKRKK